MATEVEKGKKAVADLEVTLGELNRNLAAARQRCAEHDKRRNDLLLRVNTVDEKARRELRDGDDDRRRASEDEQACAAGIKKTTAELADAKHALAQAEALVAIEAAETEKEGLGNSESKLRTAMEQVRDAMSGTLSAIDGITARLQLLDPVRFDSGYAYKVRDSVQSSITLALHQIASGQATDEKSFLAGARHQLEAGIAQLRYVVAGGKPQPGRGEKLYRTIGGHKGLRDLDLPHGSLIALTAAEADPLLKSGSLEMAEAADTPETFDPNEGVLVAHE